MFNQITNREQEQSSQSYTMEPMEGRVLMAVDVFMKFDGVGSTEAPLTPTVTAPTTGVLIGLLLPAVQKIRA